MKKDMAATDLLFLQSFSLDFAPWAALKKRLSDESWQHLCVGLGKGKEEPARTRRNSNPTILQIDKLREVFLKYDKNSDGRISIEEFANLTWQGHYSTHFLGIPKRSVVFLKVTYSLGQQLVPKV